MLIRVSGTYDVIANLGFTQLQQNELYFECDTSVAPVTIILPKISDFQGYLNVKVYVSDLTNNAFNNNITVVPSGTDTINQSGGVTININNGTFAFWIASTSQWIGLDSHTFTGTSYYIIEDEGSPLPQRTTMNFVGDGVNASDVSGKTQIDIPIQPAYKTVQDEGTSVTQRNTLNFVGDGVSVSDVGGKTQVNIPLNPAYSTIQEEGTPLTQQSVIDFQGDGISASNGVGKTIVTVPIQPAYSNVQVGGIPLTQRSTINFIGNVTVGDVGGKTQVNVVNQQAYKTVQDEGTPVTQRTVIDFKGIGVDVTDDALNSKTVVTFLEGLPATSYGLYSQTANSVPVTATTLERTLIGAGVGTLSVPANGFFVGGSFRADFGGIVSTGNNQSIRIRVKTATGVVFLDSGLQPINNVTNTVWTLSIDFTIRQIGGVNVASIVALGRFTYAKSVNAVVEGFAFNTVNASTFDTTIPNTLEVTAQWGSNSALNTIYSDIFILNKIY